jgi:hypothetical protein
MIFIPYNVPSSKNSRRNFGKFSLLSKNAQNYLDITKAIYKDNKEEFLKMLKGKEKPYLIGMHFVRGSKHKADFQNLVQLPLDIMQKEGINWLENDSVEDCFPIPFEIDGKLYSYDKDNPGVYIKVFSKMVLKE